MSGKSSLNALRALETTLRKGGYAAASDELGVTPEAVGQLVRGLENDLGLELLTRSAGAKGLTPTPAVRPVGAKLSKAFSALEKAVADLEALAVRPSLTIAAPESFASSWLQPRIDAFLTANDDVDFSLRLDADDERADLTDADIAIAFGKPPEAALDATLIETETRFVPVVSTAVAARIPFLATIAGIATQTLIETDAAAAGRAPSWRDWQRARFGSDEETNHLLRLDNEAAAIAAALAGEGIALVSEAAAAPVLARGLLSVIGRGAGVEMRQCYHAMAVRRPGSAAKRFLSWLDEMAAKGAVSSESNAILEE